MIGLYECPDPTPRAEGNEGGRHQGPSILRANQAQTVAWTPFPATEPPDLHVAVAGDIGCSSSRLDATAAAMTQLDDRQPVDALALLGDNAYPSGDPAKLHDTVVTPFADLLDGGTDLFAVLGNHDVKEGHAARQVAALGMSGRWWARHDGDVLLGLDSNLVDDPDQLAWLERTLASATERWRIVMLHHPPYSAGYQGSSDDVRRAFVPPFERYGVQLVLAGHDHDYQRSKLINGGHLRGDGGASSTRRTGEADYAAVSFSWRHFVAVAVFADRLELRAVNQDLGVADDIVIRP
jgi:3',5'-cyclic AMP phosphodiesterase CpdA